MTPMQQRVQYHLHDSATTLRNTLDQQAHLIENAAQRLATCLLQGGKVLVCANGVSAALAQYAAALLVNRFDRERPGLPAVALTSDSVLIMAVAADQQFKTSLSRQVRTLGNHNDILLALSTGQNTASLREAITGAYDKEIQVILLGNESSAHLAEMLQSDDLEIRVPTDVNHRTQEAHLALIHCLCDLIDIQIFGEEL